MDTTNALGEGRGEAWFIITGPSDVLTSDVARLGPGKTNQYS